MIMIKEKIDFRTLARTSGIASQGLEGERLVQEGKSDDTLERF